MKWLTLVTFWKHISLTNIIKKINCKMNKWIDKKKIFLLTINFKIQSKDSTIMTITQISKQDKKIKNQQKNKINK